MNQIPRSLLQALSFLFVSLHFMFTLHLFPFFASQPIHLHRYPSFTYWFSQIQPVTRWIGSLHHLSSSSTQFLSLKSLSVCILWASWISFSSSTMFSTTPPFWSHFHISGTLCWQVWSNLIALLMLNPIWLYVLFISPPWYFCKLVVMLFCVILQSTFALPHNLCFQFLQNNGGVFSLQMANIWAHHFSPAPPSSPSSYLLQSLSLTLSAVLLDRSITLNKMMNILWARLVQMASTQSSYHSVIKGVKAVQETLS